MSFFFFLFASFLIISSLGTIFLSNPVHAVMSLILSFVNAAGLFILIGADFLAFLLIIVYVGAVVIMFLFVVMIADFKVNSVFKNITFVEGLFVFTILSVFVLSMVSVFAVYKMVDIPLYTTMNTRDIAHVLYTDHYVIFELAGVILLLAMVGSIVLVLNKDSEVKRQNLFKQLDKPSRAKVCKVQTNKGVSL